MKKQRDQSRGKFWKISDLATCLEVSQASIVAGAKITGRPVIGGMIFFPRRPDRDFIGESHRSHLANQRQAERQREAAAT